MDLAVFAILVGSLLFLIGAVAGFVTGWRADQRRLAVMTQRLLSEQRIEAATRATLSAMREALRRAER